MEDKEILLIEAIKNMFDNDPTALGIVKGKPQTDPTSRMPRQYEYINDLFGLKIADSLFFESLHSAFYDIHSYKFISDPTFCESYRVRCKAIGIPEKEIETACKAVYEIYEELKKEYKAKDRWDERSAGWHPNIEGIRAVTQNMNQEPKREEPYSGGGPWPQPRKEAIVP